MARRAYAKVYWTVQDVSERAREYGIELKKHTARHLIETSEKRLIGAMIAAGWAVIDNALPPPPLPSERRRTAT